MNTLKVDIETVRNLLNINMKKTPFCEKGFYISNAIKGLGNNPLHHAGAIYLQEPSAMSAVSALEVKKGDKVLDLCAAPGGKSTQIAAELASTGLLWSNEIVLQRAKILCSNIERCGIKNSIVSNAHPELIAKELCGYFDKVLVDAPCSGEGMVRREPNILTEWKKENREICAKRDLKILESAAKCLKKGGILVYSTCTLSQNENEMVIDEFLRTHTDFSIESINKTFGRNAYQRFSSNQDIVKCRRILFADGGEGHFVAKLKFHGENFCNVDEQITSSFKDSFFDSFIKDNFTFTPNKPAKINNSVLLLPEIFPITKSIHILKAGVKAGEFAKNRFVPAHELFMSLSEKDLLRTENININDDKITKFLHGAEIDCDKKGYTGLFVNGIAIGFGKASNGKLKNHYPKGLRIIK